MNREVMKIDNDEMQPFVSEKKEPEELKEILLMLYQPCETAEECDDMLEGYEVFEAVSPYCETSREFLFNTLVQMGFVSRTLENNLYWLVKFNN